MHSSTQLFRICFLILSVEVIGFFSPLIVPIAAQESREEQNGQTVGEIRPEEPDLELPTIVLEYEAIQRQDLEIVLPEEDYISLPEFSEQLPEAERMSIGENALDILVPAQPEPQAGAAERFFSEGVIGGGSDNHLIGDIALYKRGDSPLFQFRFSHEGIDGYGQNEPGEGFFDRREELSGGVEFGKERHILRMNGEYLEKETGLQDFTDEVSVIHRLLSASGEYRFDPESLFSLSLNLAGHSGSQYIGAQDRERELFLGAGTSLAFEWERVLLGTGGSYTAQETPGNQDLRQGDFFLQAVFYGDRFDMNGKGGVHWDEENDFLFPWNIRLEGAAGEKLQYRIEGGYLIRDVLYRDLWAQYSLLDTGESLNITRGWNASIGLGLNLGSRSRVSADVEWRSLSGVPVPDDLEHRDTESGLFPFSLARVEEVELNASAALALTETLEIRGAWKGLLIYDTEGLDPLHLITAELKYENSNTGFGAGLDGQYSIEPTDSLPVIGAALEYRLSEGVRLILEGSDFFGSFYEDGRPWWGEYEARGFHMTLKTEISL